MIFNANEIAMWQYLIDNDIDSDDWRYDVLSAMFADGTGDMSGIKKYLDDNDWRGFCQYRLDNEILTEGEKWEYQYRLDKDISFDKSNEKKNDLIMTVANAKNTIATMGDAKSDGQNITISEYGWLMALTAAIIIAVVTFILCMAGLRIGKKFGTQLSGKANILGGVILIGIGLEIFITGVF